MQIFDISAENKLFLSFVVVILFVVLPKLEN